MVLEILKDVRNIIDDKIARIEKFEKWVNDEFTLDEKRNFKKTYLKYEQYVLYTFKYAPKAEGRRAKTRCTLGAVRA